MIVYGDLLFLINFSMDFLCFYISCRLMHQKLPIFRMCIAAILGGIYSVLSLFLSIDKEKALMVDLLMLTLMCLSVYFNKETSFKRIFKGMFLYFFVSALFGGLMTALFSFFNRVEVFAYNHGLEEGVDVWIFAILVVVGSLITLGGGRLFRTSSAQKTVVLEIEGESDKVELIALVDSGNLASEPISGKSVVFVNVEKCKKIIGNTMYNAFINSSNTTELPINVLTKIRMIPTGGISGKSFLPAMKFKSVFVEIGKNKKQIDVYIAFVKGEQLGEYDAIISHETIV